MPRSTDSGEPSARARVAAHDASPDRPRVATSKSRPSTAWRDVVVDLVRAGDPARARAPTSGSATTSAAPRVVGTDVALRELGVARRSPRRRRGARRRGATACVSAYGLTSRSPGTSASPSSPSTSNAMHLSSSDGAAPEVLGDAGDAGQVGRVHLLARRRVDRRHARCGRRVRRAPARDLDVRRVVAVRAPHEVVLADRGDGHELVVDVAADLARLTLDGAEGRARSA